MIGPLCSSNAGMANATPRLNLRLEAQQLEPIFGSIPECFGCLTAAPEPKTLPHNYRKFMTTSLGFSYAHARFETQKGQSGINILVFALVMAVLEG